MSEQNNPFGNENNTGHIWDDNLRELNNDPPQWWMYGLWASVAFVVIYFILYPAIPLVNSHTPGILGWTSTGEYRAQSARIDEMRRPLDERVGQMSVSAIVADRELAENVSRASAGLFGEFCAACHAVGGAGNPGFPILANDDWMWGGTVDRIHETIVRGRQGQMPAHGHLSETQIMDLTRHVLAMGRGQAHEPGRVLYEGAGACFACHGMDGSGNTMLGAPNLTNGIWLHGGSEEAIAYTIRHGINAANDPNTRVSVMPAFGDRLSENDIKKLAVYVHQLGGGQ